MRKKGRKEEEVYKEMRKKGGRYRREGRRKEER